MNLAAVYRHRFSECEKLALAGVWKDDPDIEEIVREARRRRGQPLTE